MAWQLLGFASEDLIMDFSDYLDNHYTYMVKQGKINAFVNKRC